MKVEQLSEVGGGRHLRLRLRAPAGALLNAIFFSTTTPCAPRRRWGHV
jgi:hypothetical protein